MRRFSSYLFKTRTIMSGPEPGTAIEHFHSGAWEPPVDIFEQPDRIIVVVELPGVERDEVSVVVQQGVLEITGMRPKRIPEATERVHQMEIAYGHFARYVQLPHCSDPERIEAELKDGYLTIEIPREP